MMKFIQTGPTGPYSTRYKVELDRTYSFGELVAEILTRNQFGHISFCSARFEYHGSSVDDIPEDILALLLKDVEACGGWGNMDYEAKPMTNLPKIIPSPPPPPPRKVRPPSPWHKVGEAVPEDCTDVLIRVRYISFQTGRYVTSFSVYAYSAQFGGFALHENAHRDIDLKVTHWMAIPPIT